MVDITLITQDFPPITGGIQTYSSELAKALKKRCQLSVVAPRTRGWQRFDQKQPYDIYRYPCLNTSSFGFTTSLLIPYFAKKKRSRIALHASYPTAMGSFIAKKMGHIDRYYIAAHGREIQKNLLGSWSRVIRSTTFCHASRIFAVSNYTRNLIIASGHDPEKVSVVPNGIDLDFFQPYPKKIARERLNLSARQILLTAGRLIPRKGIDTTLEALKIVALKYPDLLLIILGEGPYRRQLEKLAEPLIKNGQVQFHGSARKEELPLYYSAADLFLMPSREEKNGCVEGFGLVFLEANSCGTPVIGSTSGGIPDAISHGENGLLVPPNNHTALSQTIEKLLDDEPYRLELAGKALRRAQLYSWQKTAGHILCEIEADEKEQAS